MSMYLKNYQPVMKSIFDDFLSDNFFQRSSDWVPQVNVKEGEDEFQLEVAAPGYKKDQFNIEIEGGQIAISAKMETEVDENTSKWHRREFSQKSFKRTFSIPKNANPDSIKAQFTNGILDIRIPKQVEKKKASKLIEIQ